MGIQLSFSAAQKYILSPMSYFLHYYLRLRAEQTGSALVFGGAIDEALNVLLLERNLEKAELVFLEKWFAGEINGKFETYWNTTCIKFSKADYDDAIFTSEDKEMCETCNPSWVSMRRKGLLILRAYNEQVLPHILEVIAVQEQIKITNEVGDSFIGIVDLICRWDDGRVYICDNKTSSIKYADASANESAQLATYYEALKDKYDLDGIMYIVIPKKVRKKKLPLIEIDFVFGQASEPLIEKTFEDYDRALAGIKTGQFSCTRNTPDGCCSAPWGCSFKRYCESGGQDMTGLVHVEKK